MFAFAEMTNMDPDYAGPEFDFDRIVKDLMNKVKRNATKNMKTESKSIAIIFGSE